MEYFTHGHKFTYGFRMKRFPAIIETVEGRELEGILGTVVCI